MSFARHAPAGRPVARAALATGQYPSPWGGLRTELLGSGTEALGVALKLALDSLPAGAPRRVALPAYACPNLVAATRWAGGVAEYHDLEPGELGPGSALQRQADAQPLVVLHVDAFGADTLPAWLASSPTGRVVHDLAQSFAAFQPDWRPRAHYNIASFGRAKPVSLTFGGVLICREEADTADLPLVGMSGREFALRAGVYGLSLRPGVFGLLSRIPALGIGQTHFSSLARVERLPGRWQGVVAGAVAELREALGVIREQSAAMVRLARESGAAVPASVMRSVAKLPLWRVPVLCPTPESAALLAREGASFGLSRLYGRPLPQIIGMPASEVVTRWPAATALAERLITLPTHGRLGERREMQLRRLLELRLR